MDYGADGEKEGYDVRTIHHCVNVEVRDYDDFDEKMILRSMRYRRVAILDNGWLRCVGDVDDPVDDGTHVEYVPPNRVNAVYTTEPEAADE